MGVSCLQRTQAKQELDFVGRRIGGKLSRVGRALEKIPDETQKQLPAKLGTEEGQVLAPIRSLVENVSNAASEMIDEIRKRLQEDIDPAEETSSIGSVLHALRELLDPMRSDSIPGSSDATVKQATVESGPLARTVKEVLAQTLKLLEEKINDLGKEVRGETAAAEAFALTTQKGITHKKEVVQFFQSWA